MITQEKIENMSFDELLKVYFSLKDPETETNFSKLQSNIVLSKMVDDGNIEKWIDIFKNYPKEKEISLQIIKLYAKSHPNRVKRVEWKFLEKNLLLNDPFYKEVVKKVKKINKSIIKNKKKRGIV